MRKLFLPLALLIIILLKTFLFSQTGHLLTKPQLVYSTYLGGSKNDCENENQNEVLKNPFFGLSPADTPQILAPNFISSPASEYNGTFSPDGKAFYYTTIIPGKDYITFTELTERNTWSEPKVASFSGNHPDFDPLFSPDGSRLYFSSKRSLNGKTNSHIWYVEKINGIWSEPHYVKLMGLDYNEFYSSVTREGTIYFNMWSTGKIYKAKKRMMLMLLKSCRKSSIPATARGTHLFPLMRIT